MGMLEQDVLKALLRIVEAAFGQGLGSRGMQLLATGSGMLAGSGDAFRAGATAAPSTADSIRWARRAWAMAKPGASAMAASASSSGLPL